MKKTRYIPILLIVFILNGCSVNESLEYSTVEIEETGQSEEEYEMTETSEYDAILSLNYIFNEETGELDIEGDAAAVEFFDENALYYFTHLTRVNSSAMLGIITRNLSIIDSLDQNDFEAAEQELSYAIEEAEAFRAMLDEIGAYQNDASLKDVYDDEMQTNIEMLESNVKSMIEIRKNAGSLESLTHKSVKQINTLTTAFRVEVYNANQEEYRAQNQFIIAHADEFSDLINDTKTLEAVDALTAVDFIEILSLDEDLLESSGIMKGDKSMTPDQIGNIFFVFNNETKTVETHGVLDDPNFFYNNPIDYYLYLKELHDPGMRAIINELSIIQNSARSGDMEVEYLKKILADVISALQAYEQAMRQIEPYQENSALRDVYVGNFINTLEVIKNYIQPAIEIREQTGDGVPLSEGDELKMDELSAGALDEMAPFLDKMTEVEEEFLIEHEQALDAYGL